MKTALSIIFALVILAIASPLFAQSEKLTEAEYRFALAKALDAASARDRRIVTAEKFYRGEQLTGTRNIVSDFAGPDAKRINVKAEFGGKKTSNEAIQIGGEFFCNEGNKGWRKSAKDCSKNAMMAIPDGEYEYVVETDAKDASRKIYTRRAAFTDSGNETRDAVRLKFIEIKFVTDESGLILEYSESRRGGVEPDGWSSTQVTRYEYEPRDLKITDPTKGN